MNILGRIGRRFGLRRIRAARGWHAWLASLDAARHDLAELNQGTEGDFLDVGEKLQSLLEASGRISEQSSLLVGVLAGEETERGAEELRSILERARAMAEQAESKRLTLDQMLDGVGRVTGPLADLNAKMRSFRVMATLIRIEGSRLNQGGVDFQTLAEDVRKLACDIEENSKIVLAGSVELRNIVQKAGKGIAAFETRQRAELPRIRRQAETGLSALGEKRDRASAAGRDMAARYDSVRREIGGLVTSLQFHDITRQQVEHAAAALEQTAEISAGEAALLVKVCELQSAQLEHAKDAFLAAVTQVKDSLARISTSVAQMSEQASSVMAGGGEGTFLGEMEQGFSGIRATLAECAESRYSLGTVANAVADEVRQMSGFVTAIEEIGIRMQRIALNANIKAILIGEQGSALGAVADAIQRLAAESTGQTEEVAQGIRVVADSSERMKAELLESGADLAAELERVIETFHMADQDNGRRLAEIGENGRSFSENLGALRAGIHADCVLDEVIGRTRKRLQEVVAEAGPLAPQKTGTEIHEMIRNLESQYTMHAERAVHQHAAGEAVADQAADPPVWGENVELF